MSRPPPPAGASFELQLGWSGADQLDVLLDHIADLLRHRVVLLALVGVGLVTAAFMPDLRGAMIAAAAVSMASLLLLTLVVGPAVLNGRAKPVARVDLPTLVLLVPAGIVLL